MRLDRVIAEAIVPAFQVLGERFDSREARVMLLAIGLQESRFEHVQQIGGPARGWWQFERGGGVHGVLSHPRSDGYALALCEHRGVTPTSRGVYAALVRDQVLAAGFARLLLWTDPKTLPGVNDADGAWDCYLRNWRPGRPHRHTWNGLHAQARAAVR